MKKEISEDTVRELDIIPVEYAREYGDKTLLDELDNYRIYELLQDGTVRENPSVFHGYEILYYDVTHASEEFKKTYADVIRQLRVGAVRGKKNTSNVKLEASKIVNLFPLGGNIYSTLNREELTALGHEYMTMERIDIYDMYRVEPCLSLKGGDWSDLYIDVTRRNLSDELREKIDPETIELYCERRGTYRIKGTATQKDKEM